MTPNVVTIRDVATAAGVSVATVSRVLNGNDSVDPQLAQRVRAAADLINYRPNTVARSLRTQSSNSIALIISDVTNPFFTAVARGAEDAAQERGYSLLLCNVNENPGRERQYLEIARQSLISGLVISPHDGNTDISTLRESGVPIVVIDRHLATPSDGVFVDSYEGAVKATEHLFDAGWKRPACVTGPRSAETACLRADGYREAVQKVGSHAPVVEYANFKEDGGEEAARRLLHFEQPPDALLVANAPMALGALSAIRERGLEVGRDIGIATFDDAPWAPHVSPAMTVVAQPAYEIGSRAVALLFEGIGKRVAREPREVVLPAHLIVRDSSKRKGAAAAGEDEVVSHDLGILTSELQRETTAATLDAVVAHRLGVVQLHPWTIAPDVPREAAIGAGLAATGASLDEAAFESTRGLLDERGLRVAAIDGTYNMAFPDPEMRARARAGFERVLDGCAALGTEVVTLSTGTLNPASMWRPDPRNGEAAVWDELVAEMAWAAGRAERARVTLAFEPEVSNVVDSAERARRLIDAVGSPRVKVLMDGANLFKLGDLARMEDVLRGAFELLGDEIALAHAKDLDHDGEAGKLGAGRGVLDFDLYLSLLADVGYAGPVILHGLGGRPEDDYDWSFDYVRARLPVARG